MLRTAAVVLAKELRESLRDPHVLVVSLGFPLLFYPLLVWGILQYALLDQGFAEREPARVSVQGPEGLRDAVFAEGRFARDGDDDAVQGAWIEVDAPPDADAALLADQLDLVIVGTDGGEGIELAVHYDASRKRSRRAWQALDGVLDPYRSHRLQALADAHQVSVSELRGWTIESENVSPDEEVLAQLAGMMLPGMLVLILPIAALYPAVEVINAERERSTLETTLVTAASVPALALGKVASVWALAMLSVLGNAGALLLTLTHAEALLRDGDASLIQFHAGPALAAVLGLALCALLVSAAQVVAVAPATSFKQAETAGSLLTVLAVGVMPMSIVPGLELSWATASIPLANTVFLIRGGITGELAWGPTAVAFFVNGTLAACLIYVASRLLGREDYLLGNWWPRWLPRALFGRATPGGSP